MPRENNMVAEGVARRAKAKEESVREFYERSENLQPTPTQEECDLAKVGALDIDDKEDDGSEWDDEHQFRVMQGRLPGNSPYDTRAMNTGEGGEDRPARRRGGRRKSE